MSATLGHMHRMFFDQIMKKWRRTQRQKRSFETQMNSEIRPQKGGPQKNCENVLVRFCFADMPAVMAIWTSLRQRVMLLLELSREMTKCFSLQICSAKIDVQSKLQKSLRAESTKQF